MSILRKNVISCIPVPDNIANREFMQVVVTDELVPLYDSKGNVVEHSKKQVILRKPHDRSEFTHEGISCDLFTIENQLSSGVNLKEFSGAFLQTDLSESTYLGDLAIKQVEDKINESQNLKTE